MLSVMVEGGKLTVTMTDLQAPSICDGADGADERLIAERQSILAKIQCTLDETIY